ncbi:MAG: carboxyl transferase domain-containing protein [Clostridia bacterium]|nr:carboxyl transferase domain-containing protein [Clostridia bacterium]
MDMTQKIAEFAEKAQAVQKGGAGKVTAGNMTARERISALFDEGSFVELNMFASSRVKDAAADGVITGYGSVDGRLVFAYSQDATVIGGSIGEMHAKKIRNVFEMALKMGTVVVGMLDSSGARLDEGVMAQAALGEILAGAAKISGIVPHVSLVLGACAGAAAFCATMSDVVIISKKSGKLCVSGASVVEATTGKKPVTDAVKSGNAHLAAENDAQAIELCKLLISYLPDNNISLGIDFETTDDASRTTDALRNIDEDTDMRAVVSEIADNGAYFELQAEYAAEISVGLIRLNGSSVGIVANRESVLGGGALEKAARFVRFCDAFNIPILSLTDAEGFTISAAEEDWGLARKGAKLISAFAEASVGKVNLIVNRAYGGAYVAMNSKQLGADVVLAFPTAQIGAIAPGAAVGILCSQQLHDGKERAALEEEYASNEATPYKAAQLCLIDDVIEPADARARIILTFEMLKSKRVTTMPRKHDNMPL